MTQSPALLEASGSWPSLSRLTRKGSASRQPTTTTPAHGTTGSADVRRFGQPPVLPGHPTLNRDGGFPAGRRWRRRKRDRAGVADGRVRPAPVDDPVAGVSVPPDRVLGEERLEVAHVVAALAGRGSPTGGRSGRSSGSPHRCPSRRVVLLVRHPAPEPESIVGSVPSQRASRAAMSFGMTCVAKCASGSSWPMCAVISTAPFGAAAARRRSCAGSSMEPPAPPRRARRVPRWRATPPARRRPRTQQTRATRGPLLPRPSSRAIDPPRRRSKRQA